MPSSPEPRVRRRPSDDAAVRVDRGRCILCGRCVEAHPDRFAFSPSVEPAALGRPALVVPNLADDDAGLDRLRTDLHRRVKALRRSIHIRHVDAGSDGAEEWEVAALTNPVYDVQRLGIYFTATPRHADVLLVTGVGTAGMAGPLRQTFDAMPEPRVVVAAGTDATSGGLVHPTYASGPGVGSHRPRRRLGPGLPAQPLQPPPRHPARHRPSPPNRDHTMTACAPPDGHRRLGGRGRRGPHRRGGTTLGQVDPVRRWHGRERPRHRGRGTHDPRLGRAPSTWARPSASARPRCASTRWPACFSPSSAASALVVSACLVSWATPEGRVRGHGTGAGYLLLLGAVVVILVAADAFTFLFAWEALTVSFYILVGIHRRDPAEARASWVTLGVGKLSGAALLFGFLLLAGRAHSYAFSAWAAGPGRGAARHRLRADHRGVRRQGGPGPLTGVAAHRLSRRTRADPGRHGRVGRQRRLLRPLALPRHPRPPADLAGRGRAHRRRRHRVGRDRLRRRPIGAQPGHRLLERRERRDHRGRLRRRPWPAQPRTTPE